MRRLWPALGRSATEKKVSLYVKARPIYRADSLSVKTAYKKIVEAFTLGN